MGDMVVVDLQGKPLSTSSTLESPSQDGLGSRNEIQVAESSSTGKQKCNSGYGSNEDSNGIGHDSSRSQPYHAREEELQNGIDIKEVDFESVQGSSNKAAEGKGGVAGCRQDGFQELLQLAQEFESDEAAKRDAKDQLTDYCEDPLKEKMPKENGVVCSDEQHKLSVKDNQLTTVQKTNTKLQKLEAPALKKGGHLTNQVQKIRVSSSSSIFSRSEPKVGGKVEAERLSKRKKVFRDEIHLQTFENTALPQSNAIQRSASIGSSRSNFTVPQPFALATDKRASIGGRVADGEAGYQTQKLHRNGTFRNSSARVSQVPKKMEIKPYIVKSIHSESMKHLEESLMTPGKPLELKHDEESQSVSSIQSGSATSKAKLMGSNGFFSKCEERAEKRKEFYSKLEEKYKSKEEEKNQLQAKTKEEIETEIRQLRKSLTFRATPMPTFYQEGVSTKVELKKIPLTRAKSPRLGRRKSCVGLDSAEIPRHSFRSNHEQDQNNTGNEHKLNGENGEKVAGKGNSAAGNKNPVRRSLATLSTEKPLKSKLSDSIDTPKPDMDTGSVNGPLNFVKKRLNSGNFLFCASVKGKFDGQGISKDCETNSSLGKEGDHPPQSTESEAGVISESIGSSGEGEKLKDNNLTDTELLKCESARSKSLSSDLRIVSKGKPGRAPEQVLSVDNEHANAKATKAIKRERLKAATPSFRNPKHASIRTGSVKQTMKSGRGMIPAAVADVVVQ